MKTIVILILCLASGMSFAQSQNCRTAAKDYWAPKLTKQSTTLGKRMDKTGAEPIKADVQELLAWKNSVVETARELDSTFAMTGDNTFVSLANVFLTGLMSDGTLLVNENALPDLRFNIAESFDEPDRVVLIGSSRKRITVDTSTNSQSCESILECSAPGQNVCQQLVDSWAKGVSAYKNEAERLVPTKMAKLAVGYGKDWDRYFIEGRSQTTLDRLVTARWNRNMFRNEEFQKAPNTQCFFLHPGVVMEYVEDAADGEQLEASLAVEWFGMNRWRGCNIGFTKVPCGFSIISLYSDKASTKDIGHGLMFHVNNAYSLGVVDRDGETGFFVTMDLLKALESKIKNVEKWKKKADKYLN